MVASIVATYERASYDQTLAGRQWYPTAGKIATAIAEATGTNEMRVGFAIAALSPRNPWKWNIADAYAFAAARAEGRTMPKATTFKRNSLRAWQALDYGNDPWSSSALKVRAFVAAIMGDHDSVVVDIWAYRAACGHDPKSSIRPKEYAAIEAAYREAALITGELPAHLQALVWLVCRTEGTARQTSNGNSFKAGTPEFVRTILGG
jgi:hypothetical protein